MQIKQLSIYFPQQYSNSFRRKYTIMSQVSMRHPKPLKLQRRQQGRARHLLTVRRSARRLEKRHTALISTMYWSRSTLIQVFWTKPWPSSTHSSMIYLSVFPQRLLSWQHTARSWPPVHGSVCLILPGELAKHAISEGTKFVMKFSAGGKWSCIL